MKKHTDELSGTTVLEKIFNANINWRSYPPWVNWPRDSQKLDLYINEEEMYELLFSSQQPKAKEFKRYCCNVMFPQIREQLTNKRRTSASHHGPRQSNTGHQI